MIVSVDVDPGLCIGSGECVRLVPRAFLIDESAGVSTPLPDAPDAGAEALLEAAGTCPTNAIRVVAADGSVLFESAGR